MIVYKAVVVRSPAGVWFPDVEPRQDGLLLQSLIVYGSARVTYPVGEWVSTYDWLAARGYYLTAFSDEQSARSFIERMHLSDTAVVFEAEADGVLSVLPRCASVHSVHSSIRMRFIDRRVWPANTIMAERLRLLSCVWSKIVYLPLGIERTEWP